MPIPQLEAEQDDVVAAGGGVVGGAAAAGGGVDDDMEYMDEPPPQALKPAINKVQTAAGTHERRVADPFA